MKNQKTLLTKLMLVLVMLSLAFTFVACESAKKPAPTGEAKTAEYYYAVDGAEYTVSLNGTNYTLAIAGEESKGTFNLQGESIVLNPESGDAIEGTLKGDELSIVYSGKTYVLLEKVTYTITYVMGTGAANAEGSTESVVNGKTVADPVTPAAAEGYIFSGWYANAQYTTVYDFAQPVRGNVSVYAKFEEVNSDIPVFTVTLYDGAEVVGTVKTVNGVLRDLPQLSKAGAKFLGWWVSQTGEADKLSYQYKGETIGANMSLYAVWESDAVIMVSVSEGKIEWTSAGVNVQYTIKITAPDGSEETKSAVVTYLNYNFDAAGEYTIEVTSAGKKGVAVYKNKSLDKVTIFDVEGNVLKFNAVAGAEGYLLSIVCENEGHNHAEKIDLGNVTEYDFTACGMGANGLTFTVETYAEGLVGAVSEAYVLKRELGAIVNLKVDDEGDYATWDAVENAQAYKVTITVDGEKSEKTVNEAKVDLSEYSGNISVTVQPVAQCYISPEAAAMSFAKSKLAVPAEFKYQNGKFTWKAVSGAVSYIIKMGEKEVAVNGTEYTLTDAEYAAAGYPDLIYVKAVGGALVADSNYTEAVNVGEGSLAQSFHYTNGMLVWDGVYGATGYSVKVNGEEIVTNQDVNSVAVELTAATTGASIKYYRGETQSQWVDITVTAYKATYDKGTGDVADNKYGYVVVGDELDLEPVTRVGYDFIGWFLNDQKVAAGMTLSVESDVTVVAKWTAKKYTVTVMADNGGSYDKDLDVQKATYEVTYGSPYTLPVPYSNSPIRAFAGYYTETKGIGILYTNHDGGGMAKWNDARNVTLYAHWVDIFKFDLISNGTAYSVSAGTGISLVNKITIPELYEGKPVTTIEGSAFDGCASLIEINMPDSITNVVVGIEGGYTTGSAFNGTYNLLDINVYPTVNVTNPKYTSVDGILYAVLPDFSLSLVYYPKYREEEMLVLPDDVTEIPIKALYAKTKLYGITLPAGLKTIGASAFQSGYFTSIIFKDAGANAPELTIGKDAFKSCSKLTKITLPSNVGNVSAAMFDGCSLLETVEVPASNKYKTIGGVLFAIDELTGQANKLIYYPRGREEEYTIPVGVTTIGEEAFKSATKLTKITIPGHVTLIEQGAFRSCTGMLEVVFKGEAINDDLTIKQEAFYGCSKLTEITLPANLKTLEIYAFGYCNSVKTVIANCERPTLNFADYAFHYNGTNKYNYVEKLVLGEKMAVVDVNGVFGSERLVNVEVHANNPYYTSQEGVLFDKAMLNLVYFPTGKTGAYVIPDTVTSIGTRVFDSKEISSITIGNKVTSIGDEAFSSCKKLTSITFVEGGTQPLTIGAEAFTGCNALTQISLPERLVSIGDGAFKSCTLLTTIYIPKNVENIAVTTVKEYVPGFTANQDVVRTRVFDYCTKLATIEVDPENAKYASVDGVLYMKNDAGKIAELMLCPAGKGGVVDVVKTVTSIHSKAFYNNDVVEEIMFSEGIEGDLTFGLSVFYDCDKLAKVALPSGLKVIGEGLFYYCESIEEVFIPNTVKVIENNAFNRCTNLKKIVFEDGLAYETVVDETTGESVEKPIYLSIGNGSYTSDQYGTSTYYGAFANTPKLVDVVLPDRLLNIGEGAFAMSTALTTINIPAGVEVISFNAFRECASLTNVNFSNAGNLKDIQGYAFYKTNVEKAIIPEGVQRVGYGVYYYCYNLKEVYIPASVEALEGPSSSTSTTMMGYTFGYCDALSKVTFAPNSKLKKMGSATFWNCKSLTEITIPASVEEIDVSSFRGLAVTTINIEPGSKLKDIGNYVFADNPNLTTFVVPASVEKIGNYAFQNNPKLTTITFEENSNLKSIGLQAFKASGLTEIRFPKTTGGLTLGTALFANCTDLKKVYFSSSVTSIEGALTKCSSIEEIVFAEDSNHFKVYGGNKQLIVNLDDTAIRYILGTLPAGEFRIPDGVSEISASAFAGQHRIEKIIVPNSVKKVGLRAFADCTSLKEVVFEEGCNIEFDQKAFMGCTSLESIKWPAGMDFIPAYTFYGCISLKNVTLPNGIKTIGGYKNASGTFYNSSGYTFGNCKSLSTITLPESVTTICTYSFYSSGLKTITIPAAVNKINTYAFAHCDKLVTANFANGAKLTGSNIAAGIFDDCDSLKSVDMSSLKITTFPSYGFRNCKSLTEIKLPATLTTISSYAFAYCESLESIEFPANVDTILTYAFRGAGLTSVTLPSKLQVLGSSKTSCSTSTSAYTFADCKNLVTVNLGPTLTKIGAYTFMNCEKLENINLEKVVLIGTQAFANCTSLTSANLKGLQKSTPTGTRVFSGCTSLTDVEFANVPTTLGSGMFENCTSLAEITLPTTLTALPGYLLMNTAITEIVIPASVANIGTYTDYYSTTAGHTFAYCTNLEKVTFAAGSKCEGYGFAIFKGCTNLTSITLPDKAGRIRGYAFADTGLTSFHIPANVYQISNGVFGGSPITAITVDANNEDFVVEDGILYNVDKTEAYYYPNKSIEDFDYSALTDINGALYGNTTETELILPEGMTVIPDYMFYGFTGLTKITLPSTLTEIGEFAFYGCTNLKSIEFPASLTTIGESAFENSGLETLVLPETITYIDTLAFAGSALKEVTINLDIAPKVTLNSTTGLPSSYTDNTNFKAKMFANCTELTTVTLGDKVTGLAGTMFQGCTSLKSIDLNKVIYVSSYVFNESGLESVVIPEAVQYVGSYAFMASALKTVVIEAALDLSSMGSSMFKDCEELVSVEAYNLTKLRATMFENCGKLSEFKYDRNKITHVYADVFNNCVSLASLAFNVDLIEAMNQAFEGWTEEQTLIFVGNGRDLASLELSLAHFTMNDAKFVLVESLDD